MAKIYKFTQEGLKKLQDELENLKTNGRKDIAERIKVARGYGDLSENSEYDDAKNEQAKIEARIVELEVMLKNHEIISEDDIALDKVAIGVKVTVFDTDMEENFTYSIVGSAEADPMNDKISDESPVGKALLGRSVNEEVEVDLGGDKVVFKILSIEKQ
ncbi:MAG: transcription elongation factor GreA [Clostridia bacterium]|nr:transcription elongation factor GreA [Clostridia bacterium]MBQ7108692.1 transcription elongation factor GreA [Clostridia bacterium]